MKLYINSFDYRLKMSEKYLKVIKKYAKDGNVKVVKKDGDEIAIIEVDSLEILPKFEKDLKEARGIVHNLWGLDIRGLIFNTIDEKRKIYQIEIYDSYNE